MFAFQRAFKDQCCQLAIALCDILLARHRNVFSPFPTVLSIPRFLPLLLPLSFPLSPPSLSPPLSHLHSHSHSHTRNAIPTPQLTLTPTLTVIFTLTRMFTLTPPPPRF